MRIWVCPLGCPLAARTSCGLPWSDAVRSQSTCRGLRPGGGRNERASELAGVGPDPGATDGARLRGDDRADVREAGEWQPNKAGDKR